MEFQNGVLERYEPAWHGMSGTWIAYTFSIKPRGTQLVQQSPDGMNNQNINIRLAGATLALHPNEINPNELRITVAGGPTISLRDASTTPSRTVGLKQWHHRLVEGISLAQKTSSVGMSNMTRGTRGLSSRGHGHSYDSVPTHDHDEGDVEEDEDFPKVWCAALVQHGLLEKPEEDFMANFEVLAIAYKDAKWESPKDMAFVNKLFGTERYAHHLKDALWGDAKEAKLISFGKYNLDTQKMTCIGDRGGGTLQRHEKPNLWVVVWHDTELFPQGKEGMQFAMQLLKDFQAAYPRAEGPWSAARCTEYSHDLKTQVRDAYETYASSRIALKQKDQLVKAKLLTTMKNVEKREHVKDETFDSTAHLAKTSKRFDTLSQKVETKEFWKKWTTYLCIMFCCVLFFGGIAWGVVKFVIGEG